MHSNSGDESALSHFSYARQSAQLPQLRVELLDLRLQILEHIFLAKYCETGPCRRTTKCIASVTMPVGERPTLRHRSVKLREDFFGRERIRQRKITTAQSFPEHHDIGQRVLMLARKHFSGPTESRHYFIGNHERALPIAPIAHRRGRSRRPNSHSRGTLNHRLDHHRRDFVRLSARKF